MKECHSPSNSQEPDVFTPREFLKDLSKEARRANGSVILKAMHEGYNATGFKILWILRTLRQLGVQTKTHIDDYSTMVSGDGTLIDSPINWISPHAITQRKKTKELLAKMSTTTDLHITNVAKNPLIRWLLPVLGRDHIKGTHIKNRNEEENKDEHIFYFGGQNFNRSDTESHDFMVKFKGDIAKNIGLVFDQINRNPPQKDLEFRLSEDTSLLYDAGIPHQSKILDRAVTLVRRAEKSIINTCVMYPDGKMEQALKNAIKRGITTDILTPSPGLRLKKLIPFNTNALFLAQHFVNTIQGLFKKGKVPVRHSEGNLHAKLLIVDGEVAMFGSHNLLSSGVRAGTREWHIVTTNKSLIAALEQMYASFTPQNSHTTNSHSKSH